MARRVRRIKLIKPQFQLKMVATFLCVGVACVVVQFTLLNVALTEMAVSYPQHSISISNSIFDILWDHLFLTLGLMIPLTVCVGVLVTFRVAGPIYRFENYLKAIARGEDAGRCTIRTRDEFHELCAAINEALDRLREDANAAPASDAVATIESREDDLTSTH